MKSSIEIQPDKIDENMIKNSNSDMDRMYM